MYKIKQIPEDFVVREIFKLNTKFKLHYFKKSFNNKEGIKFKYSNPHNK